LKYSLSLLIAIFLLIFFLAGCAGHTLIENDPSSESAVRKRIEELKPNVVHIETIPQKGAPLYGFGYIVGEIWNKDEKTILIVTANHTIRPDDQPGFQRKKVNVMFYSCIGHGYVEAEVLSVMDEEKDIAMLKVDITRCNNISYFYPNGLKWKQHRFAQPEPNEPVWFIGIDRKWEIPEHGIINKIDNQNYTIDINIKSVRNGTSGAPLINQDGMIIGLITMDKEGSRSQAISIEIINDILSLGWGLPFDKIINFLRPVETNCDLEKGALETNQLINKFGMRFVLVESGEGLTGVAENTPDRGQYDLPLHKIHIDSDFYLQKTEVTQCQWQAMMGEQSASFRSCGEDCPVENVSWLQVQAFIESLNDKDNKYQYRLPTEKEWEYACRMGKTTDYPWGNKASCDKMMFENGINGKCVEVFGEKNFENSPMKVMSFPFDENRLYKIYDMNGNVREWCHDVMKNAPLPDEGNLHVVRGGGWESTAAFCRCGARDGIHEANASPSLGFRLIAEPIK
jgi:formylglycine-generating enzyme required for sulfatase activity